MTAKALLWIRIRYDRHHFGGSISESEACRSRSGSGFVAVIQNIENYNTYDDDKEDKTFETGTYVNQSKKKILIFQHVKNLG
jgi:hypothetical protein